MTSRPTYMIGDKSYAMLEMVPIRVQGSQYVEDKLALAEVGVGSVVELVRDPGNPHDKNAIKVCHGEARIGYAPAAVAAMAAKLIDAYGQRVYGVVVELADGPTFKFKVVEPEEAK